MEAVNFSHQIKSFAATFTYFFRRFFQDFEKNHCVVVMLTHTPKSPLDSRHMFGCVEIIFLEKVFTCPPFKLELWQKMTSYCTKTKNIGVFWELKVYQFFRDVRHQWKKNKIYYLPELQGINMIGVDLEIELT